MRGCWQGEQPSIRALHVVRREAQETHEIILLTRVHDTELSARGKEKRGESRMTDDRDITERLEDKSIDGAIFLRINAAMEIRALRHHVARLEDQLAKVEVRYEKLGDHSSKQALDIVTLGQEVGRLWKALSTIVDLCDGYDPPASLAAAVARAALAEKGEK